MNEIIDKVLLTGDKFVSELYLRQPGFTCSAYELFTKHCKTFKNSKKQII